MKKTTLSFLSCVFLLITGCAEKPKSIGGSLINPNDIFTIAETTFTAISDTTFKITVANGFGTSNLVGRLSANEELTALFDFIPTSVVDSLVGAQIDTAELRLTVNYRLNPSASPIEFEVREIKQSWSQSTFTADSLTASTVGSAVLGTFSDSMNFGQEVVARLNSNAVRRWIDAYKTSTDTTLKEKFYGFAVKPKNTIVTGVIGFTTFNTFASILPRLVIKYTKYGKLDSLVFTSGQDTYAATFVGPPVLSKFEVRGAFGVRSKVRFDVSALANKPIVNRAIVTVKMDTTASLRSGFSPDSVVALLGLSNSLLDSSSSSIYTYGVKKTGSASQPVYEFAVTNIAQRWINNINPNEGLVLRWAAEISTSDKIVFLPSSDPDPSKRPTLTITYSKK